jgi:hypothetical protein
MLPLMSKTRPTDRGASSLAKTASSLLDLVLEEPEVLLFQPRHDLIERRRHRDGISTSSLSTRILGGRTPVILAGRARLHAA